MASQFNASLSGLGGYVSGRKGTSHEQSIFYADQRDLSSSDTALEALLNENMNLVFKMVSEYHIGHPYLDQHRLFSAAQEAAWKSAGGWDQKRGSTFSSYLQRAILNSFMNENRYWRMKCRDLSKTVGLEDYFSSQLSDDESTWEDFFAGQDLDPAGASLLKEKYILLYEALEHLTPEKRGIIERYYLGDDSEDMTDEKLKDEMDVSVTRACVQRRRKEALAFLRRLLEKKLK